jgi:hypothetical protein
MKIRDGFVSNSSSSSFMIPKSALTAQQIYKIMHFQETVKKILKDEADMRAVGVEIDFPDRFNWYDDGDWSVREREHSIKGTTMMDNFDFHRFLKEIGVPQDEIEWGDNGGDW